MINIHHGIVNNEKFDIDRTIEEHNKKSNMTHNSIVHRTDLKLQGPSSDNLYRGATLGPKIDSTVAVDPTPTLSNFIDTTKLPSITSEAPNQFQLTTTSKSMDEAKQHTVIPENKNYDDEDDSFEDFSVEFSGSKYVRKNKFRVHTSYQMTALNKPLMQGFLATVGYPKFYVGDSECNWKISAPYGQKIRLTILDLNLRSEFWCLIVVIFGCCCFRLLQIIIIFYIKGIVC